MEALQQSTDALFILLGAVMVLAMHAGFAFLELGTVRRKNQVNALVKILADFLCRRTSIFWSATWWPTAATFLWVPNSLPQKTVTSW